MNWKLWVPIGLALLAILVCRNAHTRGYVGTVAGWLWRATPIILLLLTALTVGSTIGYGLYSFSWFGRYWTVLGIAALITVASAIKYGVVRNYLGMVAGQLWYNNNWRWGALIVLAVIFSISAPLAGFGRPLLTSSAKEVKASLAGELNKHPTIVSEFKQLWHGTNTPLPSVSTRPPPVIEKQYRSWWWWLIPFCLWLLVFIYFPFAYADEAKTAIMKAIRAVERRKRQDTIRTSSAETAITPPAATSTGAITKKVLWKQIFQVEVLVEILEELGKLLLAKVVSLFR